MPYPPVATVERTVSTRVMTSELTIVRTIAIFRFTVERTLKPMKLQIAAR
jgi:hypothetical protein